MNKCAICNELIGTDAPTMKLAIGFGDFDEYDFIVIHRDCVEIDNPITILTHKFETDF